MANPTKANRPNIILLHTDQQRFDTIAALGHRHMVTPQLDRLVGQGTAFACAYSANPVCMPARHDLITGTSARYHGYYNNQHSPIADYGLPTVPRLLTQAGYQTVAVGKMHFNPEREHHGFEHMYLMEELPGCRENDAYLQYLESVGYGHIRCQHGVRPVFYHTPQESLVPEEHHGSAWVATKVIELLSQQRNRPFFIFASWVGPHPPYYMPRRYLDMYRNQTLPDFCADTPVSRRHVPESPGNPSPHQLRRMREAYCGAVSLIDTHIGRILDMLEQTGQLDNTLILFTADHGEMLGDRKGYQKHVPYEGSAHIPLIMCGPGVGRAQNSDVPVTTWDVSATILEAAGVTLPAEVSYLGQSLRQMETMATDRVICYHHARGRSRYVAAVGYGYKFIHWYNGGEEELYNLRTDAWEQSNLLDANSMDSHITSQLRQACLDFEIGNGPAEQVHDGCFCDLPYAPPQAHAASLFPLWANKQYPHWMNGYSKEDLALIAAEMRRCLQGDCVYTFRDKEWRQQAIGAWEEIGGDAAVMIELFAMLDRCE